MNWFNVISQPLPARTTTQRVLFVIFCGPHAVLVLALVPVALLWSGVTSLIRWVRHGGA